MLVQKPAFKGMELEFFASDTPNINDFMLQMCAAAEGQPMYFYFSFSVFLCPLSVSLSLTDLESFVVGWGTR